ncbi:hypothetical protein NB550_00025 [Vibrio parahaemolyticus]|uniref:hypothetical protein n=1 Tax=Vibrio parahaemolyticus TaxID=670 RepID=UPI00215C8C44|nr:hypothetical protein [Vibrio parahaemolyticus]MCR9778937.1 hypothetical protein [Vibrio parahaemolyticus]MCR9889152.1 hypothetical protein [Vibrio parahaemolyticus]MCR9915889.1 hypothetical protein [Vibrio parahaemolyticus]
MNIEKDILEFLNSHLKKHCDYQIGMRFTQYECKDNIFSFSYEGSDNKQVFSDVINKTFNLSLLPVT